MLSIVLRCRECEQEIHFEGKTIQRIMLDMDESGWEIEAGDGGPGWQAALCPECLEGRDESALGEPE
jgi:hypothetical protein